MIIPIASDHAGFQAKEKSHYVYSKKLGYEVKDLGVHK